MLEQRYVRRRGLQLIKLRTVCLNMRIVRQISTLLIIYAIKINVTECEINTLYSFRYSTDNIKLIICIDGLLCIGATNCTDRSNENSKLCSRIGWPSFLKLVRPPMETIRPPPVQISRRIRSPVTSSSNTCKVPPQPQNGQWKLHPDQCPGEQECNVAQRTELGLGSLLVYSCYTGFKIRGSPYVSCIIGGKWINIPDCVPECGIIPRDFVPLIVSGNQPNITEIPWHASLYRNVDKQKQFFCGATVIKENLLITAANCVYNEKTRKLVQAKSIYVLTGNIYRDYDYPSHDQRHVNKNQVKRIYIRRSYLGLVRNYLWDIAILELVTPFVLSTWLVPVCIDIISDSSVLKVGSSGKVARFGRTHGESSMVLQALTVPVISFSQCSQQFETEQFITVDKFCTGYTNGSGICDGDSGGGLVFKTNNLWYLRGIVSLSFDRIQKRRDVYCYYYNLHSLYTNVSSHISWIQDVITKIEQNQIQILCSSESQTKCSYFDNKYSLLYELGFF
ncbi:clotting factor C isoform X4 [Solenopsis invicta]|uniref:clotting factor C isoform X4 n=1 Tax=Solenopsis invicta TaxID=13686 RepID=UPI00193DBD6E|nr:clotting factor C isoform X4 [Solenopsis invicta]